jgi:hypothetical protein
MPIETNLVSSSVEEMLVSLANGLREAQDALNALPPFDAFGRPMPGYFIPHVDFTFEVELAVDSNNAGVPILKVRPGLHRPQVSTTSSRRSSLISGRLVAVPPGEGLPVPDLSLRSDAPRQGKVPLQVVLMGSDGRPMSGIAVEINIDTVGSQAFAKPNAPVPGARLDRAVVVTDETGTATATLSFDPAAAADAPLLVVAQAGPASARTMVVKGS